MNKTGTAYRVFQFIITFLLTGLIAYTVMMVFTVYGSINPFTIIQKQNNSRHDEIIYLPQHTSDDDPQFQPSTMYYPNYVKSPYINHLWHWNRFPIKIYFKYAGSNDQQTAWLVLAGFDEWVNATNKAVTYQVVDQQSQSDVTVQFTNDSYIPGKPGTAGETLVNSIHNTVKSAEMTLAIGNVTNEDLQSVAAHEFGHVLGIGGHSNNKNDLMYPVETRYVNENNIPLHRPPHKITLDDLNTLRSSYPQSFNNQVGL